MPIDFYFARRLIAICSLLPVLGAVLVLPLGSVLLVGLLALALSCAMVRVWPAGFIDMLAMSLTAALAIPGLALLSEPLWAHLHSQSQIASAWFWFITGFGTFFLWLGAVRAVAALDLIHAGEVTQRFEAWCDLSPSDVVEANLLRPGQSRNRKMASPENDEGFYAVHFDVDSVALDDFTETVDTHSYLMRILQEEVQEDGRIVLLIQSVCEIAHRRTSSILEMTCTPEKGGTRCEMLEVHDHFSWLSRLAFWLQDGQAAGFYENNAIFRDGDTERGIYPSQRTLLTSIARLFVAIGLAPRNDP